MQRLRGVTLLSQGRAGIFTQVSLTPSQALLNTALQLYVKRGFHTFLFDCLCIFIKTIRKSEHACRCSSRVGTGTWGEKEFEQGKPRPWEAWCLLLFMGPRTVVLRLTWRVTSSRWLQLCSSKRCSSRRREMTWSLLSLFYPEAVETVVM